jgi:hypothetical protein
MKLVDSQKIRSLVRISINFDDTKSKYELFCSKASVRTFEIFLRRQKFNDSKILIDQKSDVTDGLYCCFKISLTIRLFVKFGLSKDTEENVKFKVLVEKPEGKRPRG